MIIYETEPSESTQRNNRAMAADKPPAYDAYYTSTAEPGPKDPRIDEPRDTTHLLGPTASGSVPYTPYMPPTRVYHYKNPVTSEQIVSLLPPDHPAMVCLQSGEHIPETKFGLLGIIAAVVWFPLGIALCLLDRKVKCKRCGQMLDNGLCD